MGRVFQARGDRLAVPGHQLQPPEPGQLNEAPIARGDDKGPATKRGVHTTSVREQRLLGSVRRRRHPQRGHPQLGQCRSCRIVGQVRPGVAGDSMVHRPGRGQQRLDAGEENTSPPPYRTDTVLQINQQDARLNYTGSHVDERDADKQTPILEATAFLFHQGRNAQISRLGALSFKLNT
jgi:hypothetical protein